MLKHKEIKRLRLEKGLTQRSLGKLVDLAPETISTIECGHHDNLRLRTLKRLGKHFGVYYTTLLK